MMDFLGKGNTISENLLLDVTDHCTRKNTQKRRGMLCKEILFCKTTPIHKSHVIKQTVGDLGFGLLANTPLIRYNWLPPIIMSFLSPEKKV